MYKQIDKIYLSILYYIYKLNEKEISLIQRNDVQSNVEKECGGFF